MTDPKNRVLAPIDGFESTEASLAFAQLEDLTARLWKDIRDAEPEELTWQPAPGMNTIGMLLAHLAVVEVFWVASLTETAFLCEEVLGIGGDDDGLPLPPEGLPPSGLAGRGLSYFHDLIGRAREYTRKSLAPLVDSDLTREIEQRRRDG